MNNTYVENWQAIKNRFDSWWKRENRDRPLMRIVARGKSGRAGAEPPDRTGLITTAPSPGAAKEPGTIADIYLNVERIIGNYRRFCDTHYFFADAFPAADINLGPGSLALYLGGEPEFSRETVWYRELCASPDEFRNLHYDENNRWWNIHLDMMKKAVRLAADDFYVAIPDIIENLDILSALRGPQNLCFDLADNPRAVAHGVKIIDSLYFNYYDRCYDILKDSDGSSSYTAFNVLGKGRVAKVQCDFCAMISPGMFREFVKPSLTAQCSRLDFSVYHLDGPDAVKHVPALMEIKELDALQWTCGAGKPDGGSPDWYPIYDKVRAAGKGLWIAFSTGTADDWAQSAKQILDRYGPTGLYFLFPVFETPDEARKMAELFG